MSITGDLLDGLIGEITAAGIGVYHASTAYASSDTAIVKVVMPDAPDRCIVLTGYRIGDEHPSIPLGRQNVQIRVRGNAGDPNDPETLDDDLYQLFQGMTDRTYGSVHVIQMLHRSSIPMGQDDNDRWEISTNWDLDVDLPATVNRP